MTSPSESALLDVAVAAARAAGNHALAHFGQAQKVAFRSRNDVKLQLDADCQALAEGVLRAAFPAHAVMGEEGGEFSEGADMLWIIDPLDGTVNFFNGLPHWCSSVAVRRQGEIVAAAVFAPYLDECYTATRQGDAHCNGRRISVSSTDQLEHALVLTGVSAILADERRRLACFGRMLGRTSKLRVLGAAALDLCFVAAGRADGLFEYALNLWDFAGGMLIAERAGGRFQRLYSVDSLHSGCLCTNGRIHDALLALVADPGA